MATDRERSIPELLKDIVGNIQDIIRSEVLLAKTEMREEGGRAARAGSVLLFGGVLGFYALGFLLLCCVYALEMALPAWAAALVVGAVLGIIAAVILKAGSKRIRAVSPTPRRTVETMKENVRWAKNQAR